MAESIKPSNVSACPVCGEPMELLSQQGGFVSAGCKPCHYSITVTAETWMAAKLEQEARTDSSQQPGADY